MLLMHGPMTVARIVLGLVTCMLGTGCVGFTIRANPPAAWQATHVRYRAEPSSASPAPPQLAEPPSSAQPHGSATAEPQGPHVYSDYEIGLWKAIRAVRTDRASGCLLENDLENLKTNLGYHEKYDLGGQPSVEGRQLLAEAEAIVASMQPKIDACKRYRKDPQYKRLWEDITNADRDFELQKRIAGYPDDTSPCIDGAGSSWCKAWTRVREVRKRQKTIEDRYGVD